MMLVAVGMMRIISVLVVGANLLGLCHGQVCTTEEYSARLSDIECAQMHRQVVLDVYNECGRDDFAEELVDLCRTHNGTTCNALLFLILFRNPIEVRSCYRDDTFGERILPCTAECKEDLEIYINDTLGCCSRSIFEDELITAFPSVVLIRGLIDTCNVSLLQNPCTTPSTLSYTPSGAVETSCTRTEVNARLATIPCSPAYLEPRLDLAIDCGFPSNEEPALACEEDDDGVICFAYTVNSSVLAILAQVDLNCIEGADTCTEACRTAVVSLRENVGCCVNNLFNTSLYQIYVASYELWSLCEVETIEFCGSNSGQVPATDVTKLLFAIASLVLALVF